MTYTRLKTPPQTAWARHLDTIRQDRDWSATEMFEDVREVLGLGPKSQNSFKPLLIAHEVSDDWARILTARYGAPAPEPEPTKEPGPSADVTGLVDAVTRALLAQTQALIDLRTDLAQVREDSRLEREAMTRMLADLRVQLGVVAPHGDTGAGAADQHQAGR